MLKSLANPIRTSSARALRVVTFVSCALVLSASFARAECNAMAECAKMDLLLLTLIEDGGKQQSIHSDFLLRAVERVMLARRICERGDVALAIDAYRRLAVNFSDRLQ
jgi:hypothetical protein